MHIETLKVFCDIIESGSVSYAASQNFVTQSAVSQQVRSLEEKYECRLLERARAGVKPTAAGQILYNSSKEIVRRFKFPVDSLDAHCLTSLRTQK